MFGHTILLILSAYRRVKDLLRVGVMRTNVEQRHPRALGAIKYGHVIKNGRVSDVEVWLGNSIKLDLIETLGDTEVETGPCSMMSAAFS